MAEQAARYIVRFEQGFPRAAVEALGAELVAAGVLAPGFIPPSAGLLRLEAIVYAKDEQGYDTVVLPDRNLVSRMARVARDGHAKAGDKTTRSAVALMAYCQAMQVMLEPSIAFHELGFVSGNSVAREELSWFRAADRGAALDWVALATGKKDRVILGEAAAQSDHDFEKPILRWRRNYVVALKAAELELTPAVAPIDRALTLLDWMDKDFLLAGPAALFVSMYYGPKAARAGLFKQLRSPDRDAAITGIKNAAWDMTHLSDFVLRVTNAEKERRRYIFASGDLSLVRIASRLFLGPDPADGWPSLEEGLREWWPDKDAQHLAEAVFARFDIKRFNDRSMPIPPPESVDGLIAKGEAFLGAWTAA
ncbi:MAG: hypothetical protein JHD15_00350 [Phenylobacterium sp.]|uniref:hypothetical protein n=1 Tax=Phenylobacterium sp. TaxID=1871053 RepID=UPI001A33780C|nr:hypothetical protein [Phenylobacterium sp.]MBJ7408807.1 hypothetical protein [Phenylobacterium sp.]